MAAAAATAAAATATAAAAATAGAAAAAAAAGVAASAAVTLPPDADEAALISAFADSCDATEAAQLFRVGSRGDLYTIESTPESMGAPEPDLLEDDESLASLAAFSWADL